MEISLDGWDIGVGAEAEWGPWGNTGDAKAKILATADGYLLVEVEADAGYSGDPHEHGYPEFLYVLEGSVRNQGQVMVAGDGYAAATGSTHADFATDTGARYLLVFRI